MVVETRSAKRKEAGTSDLRDGATEATREVSSASGLERASEQPHASSVPSQPSSIATVVARQLAAQAQHARQH